MTIRQIQSSKKLKAIIAGLILLLICVISFFGYKLGTTMHVSAATRDVYDDMGDGIGDILGGIDLGKLEDILNGLTSGKNLVGVSFLDKVKSVIDGNIVIDFGSFMGFVLSLFGLGFASFVPVIAAIIAISLSYNILGSIKGKFASESTDKVIYFVCISAIIIILLASCIGLVNQTTQTVNSIKEQALTVFPILLTIMTGIGASSSAAVYQPAVAILTTTLIEGIVLIALPIFMMSFIFSIVGNLSEGIKLKQLSEFFNSGAKWVLGTMFFLFLTFLSLQGITASVFDGISVRTAKFAISKYIPIIGGYLSDGFNLVMAGGVIVKNAVGVSAILLLAATVLPLIVNLAAFSLMLKLAAAVIEPMGDEKIPKILSQVSKQCSMLAVVVIALAFLYFVFLLLVIATGNIMI